MATHVIMPALEMAQDTGTLLRWLKREGEPVTKGEPLLEVETDKVTVEIESPASGVLANVSAREGDVIPVGQTVALIMAAGEGVSAPQADVVSISPFPPSGREEASISASPLALGIPASPKARRLAGERGIDLTGVSGTGPEGAVLASDVLNAAAAPPDETTQALPAIWRVMAERMTQSWTHVPHFYLMREVVAAGLIAMRERITPSIQKQQHLKPTYSDLLVKLVAHALRDHPRVNASWLDGTVRTHEAINVGFATAVADGLVVPVIQQADQLSIGQIAAQRAALLERAQSHTLRPADMAAGTFTISNLGMYNVDAFSAIVNPPQAALLAVGRIADRVVALAGQPVVRPTLIVTLSCDHRVVDGARAARFLDDLANLIEEPWGLLA